MPDMVKVAVYGTLRQGLHNHHLMGDAQLLGTTRLYTFDMYTAGGFPVIFPVSLAKSVNGSIEAEVYLVPESTLTGPLDSLEGHPHWYKRELVQTEFGEAWIYVMQDESYKQNQYVASGDWKQFISATRY